MATMAYQQLALETTRAIRDVRRSGRSILPEWSKVSLEELHVNFVTAIEVADWAALATRARDELRKRRDILDQMALRQDKVSALLDQADALVNARPSRNRLSDRPNYPEIRALIEQGLLTRNVPAEEIPELIDRFESITTRTVRQHVQSAVRSSEKNLFSLAQTQLTALMGATLALAVARFNELGANGTTPETAADEFCTAAEVQVKLAQLEVHNALCGGNLTAVWAVATDLALKAATTLFDEALPHAAAMALARRDGTIDTVDGGHLALRLGDTIRALLRAIAMGHQVAFLAKCPPTFLHTKRWLEAAKTLPFASAISYPPLQSIATLADDSTAMDGQELTIEGLLGPVEITHRGRKAISTAPVTGPDGASAMVVIPHIKLDSSGMVPGAFVRVAGMWKRTSAEAEGPALEIERRDFGALSRVSWSDWATAQLRPVFVTVPHGLATNWSWELDVNGAGNQLRYRTWFAR